VVTGQSAMLACGGPQLMVGRVSLLPAPRFARVELEGRIAARNSGTQTSNAGTVVQRRMAPAASLWGFRDCNRLRRFCSVSSEFSGVFTAAALRGGGACGLASRRDDAGGLGVRERSDPADRPQTAPGQQCSLGLREASFIPELPLVQPYPPVHAATRNQCFSCTRRYTRFTAAQNSPG
jgi:hypothetical protein